MYGLPNNVKRCWRPCCIVRMGRGENCQTQPHSGCVVQHMFLSRSGTNQGRQSFPSRYRSKACRYSLAGLVWWQRCGVYNKAVDILNKTVDSLPATVDTALQKCLCSFGKTVTQVCKQMSLSTGTKILNYLGPLSW